MTIYPTKSSQKQPLDEQFQVCYRQCAQDLLAAKEFYNQLVCKQKRGQGGRMNIQNIKQMAEIIAGYKRIMSDFKSGPPFNIQGNAQNNIIK